MPYRGASLLFYTSAASFKYHKIRANSLQQCFVVLSFAEKFTEVLNKQREERAERDRERIRLLTADPFDPEAQHLIAEEIRQENSFLLFKYSLSG